MNTGFHIITLRDRADATRGLLLLTCL